MKLKPKTQCVRVDADVFCVKSALAFDLFIVWGGYRQSVFRRAIANVVESGKHTVARALAMKTLSN